VREEESNRYDPLNAEMLGMLLYCTPINLRGTRQFRDIK